MRFNSGGTKDAAAVELPTAHISHLQQGSGPRLPRRRPKLEALGGFIYQLWISAVQDLSAHPHLPFGAHSPRSPWKLRVDAKFGGDTQGTLFSCFIWKSFRGETLFVSV